MSDIAIRVDNLSKEYRIGSRQNGNQPFGYRSLRDVLTDTVASPLRRVKGLLNGQSDAVGEASEPLWALKDISFEIKPGEVVGIIGRNGAGKSTLLKILSRITEPTHGEATIHGRVGSLLEVGTGFHPELTGRENIYLNGAILGMKRAEIVRQFDEIVAFAEVEQFIDTPVKHYSSGMYLRLAFAVAAHLEPEILLVDEVLAVGDAAFQKKCLGKMEDVAEQGRTVLFVSHNLSAVNKLCRRGILLDGGEVVYSGSPTDCIQKYTEITHHAKASNKIVENIQRCHPDIQVATILVNGSENDEIEIVPEEAELTFEISGWISSAMVCDLEVILRDLHDTPLAFFTPGLERGVALYHTPGPFRLRYTAKLPRMMRGTYSIDILLTHPRVNGWVGIPNAMRLHYTGTTMPTGLAIDYSERKGWMFLQGREHVEGESDNYVHEAAS